jgi:hypothetical protein
MVNSNYRIAATLYSPETWFFRSISTYALHKGDKRVVIIIITIIVIIIIIIS